MIDEQIKKKYISLLKERLGEKRFNHSLCVAKEAVKFAEENNADIDKCYIAGLLHDICKEENDKNLKQYAINSSMNVSEIEKETKPLWHSIAGAEYVKSVLQIQDNEIINAIRYHTVGNKDMTMVEKIIMMADYVSEDRDYPGVSHLRKLSHSDFYTAMTEAVKFTISDLVKNDRSIPVSTIECYNELLKLK